MADTQGRRITKSIDGEACHGYVYDAENKMFSHACKGKWERYIGISLWSEVLSVRFVLFFVLFCCCRQALHIGKEQQVSIIRELIYRSEYTETDGRKVLIIKS